MAGAYLQRIGTAVPAHDIHEKFVAFAGDMLIDPRARSIFLRLAAKSGIQHRYSCLREEPPGQDAGSDAFSFYGSGSFPSTAQRMKVFEQSAPGLLRAALDQLALSAEERGKIRHVLVTCCTGFYAPGLDFDIIDHLGLSGATERTMVGFMGCYAAINALRLARHIVRSEPGAGVLVVSLELCSLHFQETQKLNEIISFTLFGDGCSAALVTGEPGGLELDSFQAVRIADARDQITWRVGDLGFDMFLSTHVPGTIARAMREHAASFPREEIDLWAVHPGGRAILDAVEDGLALDADALQDSRAVLASFGNMSSCTVMFVLQRLMQQARAGQRGCAMSFGPGLTAETMRFHAV
jgi:predicted naringenin-chalcone synthase